MKLGIVMEALQHYLVSADCSKENRETALEALKSCIRSQEAQDDIDFWQDDFTMVSTPSLLDILNQLTYDMYGKLAKQHLGHVSFADYRHACGGRDAVGQLSTEQLRVGYDLVRNLWEDNESANMNNVDGTYKR